MTNLFYLYTLKKLVNQTISWKNGMNEEKWFTADEAVEFGFADSVKRDNAESVESEESIEDIINSKVAIAMAAFLILKTQIHMKLKQNH